MNRHIIAIGGGGFGRDVGNLALERYILRQARRRNPAVCLLPTATGDAPAYIAAFYTAFTRLRCRPTHIPLFARTPNLRDVLLSQDVIFVGGGNTKSMFATWRDWGIPSILRRAWRSGTVMAGVSAGAICWFERGVTDSWADRLRLLPCLGLLSGTCCPHYDGEPERRPSVHRFIERREARSILAIDDWSAAHFVDRSLARVVSAAPRGGAYKVQRVRTQVVESALPVVRLQKLRS
jgi:aminopeptidase N